MTLKSWAITPLKGTVVDIHPDGDLSILVPGAGVVRKTPQEVHPKRAGKS